MNRDGDRSFHLDRGARSFRPSDFGLGNVPWIVVALVLVVAGLAGLGYVFDQVGQLLPPDLRLLAIGFVLGFLVGLRVNDWSTRRSRAGPPLSDRVKDLPLSDRVKEIARDPARKIEAIKAYREETGAGLVEAKGVVEAYINSS
jgi:hypothetical protein